MLPELEQKLSNANQGIVNAERETVRLYYQIRNIERKLGIYSKYIGFEGLFTQQAIRDLVSIKYIKHERTISNLPFTKKYEIYLFLTYPEFAESLLDKQIIEVSYLGLDLNDNSPLRISKKISDGASGF
ncbi:MAG: hypothetical protein WA981_14405 [Glaciecola sp.]